MRMLAMTTQEDDEPVGRARGGVARAAALSEEERRDIAKKAAAARWGFKASHKGSFQKEFGIDVDCYVLDDDNATPVISQSGMGRVLGLAQRGNAFPRFLASKAMTEVVGADLREKIDNPIKFQWGTGGADQPPAVIHGYEASVLIDVCKAIAHAHGKGLLAKNQELVAAQASIIMGASAKGGIQNLVYALAGYQQTVEEVIRAFKVYVQEEAREYEKEFPPDLYREWYRLYQLPEPQRNKPWKFMHLTLNHVYWPLAKSNGRILELVRVKRASSAERNTKLHQFLSLIGVKALRRHLGQLLGIAQTSPTQAEYEKHVRRIFGDQHELEV
jgi:hypothetical protein